MYSNSATKLETLFSHVEDAYRERARQHTKQYILAFVKNFEYLFQYTNLKYKYGDSKIFGPEIKSIQENLVKIKSLAEELDNKFMLFVMGSGKNGKSTLINALAGKQVAKESISPETWKIDVFTNYEKSESIKLKFKDGSEKIYSKEEALEYLQNEDLKVRESKKIIRAKRDEARDSGLSIEALEEKLQELQKYYLYRSDVIEMVTPIKNSKLLESYNLVDTPGLNQEIDGMVISNAKEYYSKADGIIWVLPGDRIAGAGDKKEIERVLKEYGNPQNIIAVINRLDNIIANGQTVDGVIADAKRFYGDIFNEFIPISARQARHAQEVLKNKPLSDEAYKNAISEYEASRFDYLLNHLNRTLFSDALALQINAKIKNTGLVYSDIESKIHDIYETLSEVNDKRLTLQKELEEDTMNRFMRWVDKFTEFAKKEVSRVRMTSDLYNDELWRMEPRKFNSFVKEHIVKPDEVLVGIQRIVNELCLDFSEFLNYKNSISLFVEFKHLYPVESNINFAVEYNEWDDFSNIASNYTGGGIVDTFIRGVDRMFNEEKSKRITDQFYQQLEKIIKNIISELGDKIDGYITSIECNMENSFSEMYGSSVYVEEFKAILIELMNCKLREMRDLSVRDLIYNS